MDEDSGRGTTTGGGPPGAAPIGSTGTAGAVENPATARSTALLTGRGGNISALRGHNAALVLDLLRTAGPSGLSRPELAERTGLTPQAVSKIAARLRAEGFAADAGRRASTGGKPATALRLVPHAAHAIGLHLDRDQLTAVRTDLTGTAVAVHQAPLDLGAAAEDVLTGACAAVDALRVEGETALLGVGVAVPGPLDHRRGVLYRVTGHPQWDGFPLRAALRRRLGLPVAVDKDTDAAALGQALRPDQDPHPSFAYLHLGTGLGAGLVLDGRVYRGPRTGAGEFGHQVIQLDGPDCDCGNRGCIEALCRAAVARGALPEAARVLGEGAANLVALLGVDRVLLGGRTITAHPAPFLHGVAEVLAAHAARTGRRTPVPTTLAPGGPQTVAEGAAHLPLAPLFGH
ncbi:ROK family protein [Streptomyces sp. NPDC058045]|uniref:ROK family transcriptional regulator n=1 Tax=Streptomyces sp. NPDC058045 TaxID=3346311 RepID=UPI0036E62830